MPDAPSRVWVRYRDGVTFEDLPVVYLGRDPGTGMDLWEAVMPRTEEPSGFGTDDPMPDGAELRAYGCHECEQA